MASLVRHALIAVVAVGAATTTVSAHHDDDPGVLFAACLDTKDPDSDECLRALAAVDLDPEFYTGLAANRERQQQAAKKEEDLWTLVRACVETHDLRSDPCHRAIETSGLTPEEFAAKVSRLLDRDRCVSSRNEGATSCPRPRKDCVSAQHEGGTPCEPKLETTQSSPVTSEAVKACLALRVSLTGMEAKDMVAQSERVTTVCAKAIAESGLSPAAFWAAYRGR
jgi:hypothetical protein